ncbi:hypothetical protein MCOL_V202390 [Mycobacterium colombiense CECT 3035]|uniref:Uncharacterized protein n=1 Tax=Mycobacterium colombiense CECT 3035 TaxID=1041522 RepID=J5EKK4_9MYCO|nr:hypothetical protein MCOL_V202390 [Mycobacterium colombiense CECT 3035]
MRVVITILARVVSPLAAVLVPQALAALGLDTRLTSWPDGYRAVHRRAKAFGWQARAYGLPLWVWRRRWLPWLGGWIVFEGVIVDGVDVAVLRRPVEGRALREIVADTGHRGGDLAGDLLVQGNQLGGAPADVAGEGLRLCLASGPLCCRSAAHAIGDRKVFAHLISGCLGILYGVADSGAGCI